MFDFMEYERNERKWNTKDKKKGKKNKMIKKTGKIESERTEFQISPFFT